MKSPTFTFNAPALIALTHDCAHPVEHEAANILLTPRKRLLALSAQKFISDLSRDAFHFAKLRVNGTTAGRGRPPAGQDRNNVVLTMEDLSLALGEHGVNAKKPDYCESAHVAFASLC